ncbi:sensor histidine kinase [Desulfatitalea alkaliphila]|uniref:histidine kinase n=1 Tax=Desulfatitalea alkaliphila TaxID=2929485 RepID=A0AA41UIV1_9BACT|nr:ATP-binding protein [Desulfatitalea alkaliphila]MCJ8499917.1 ATP-binding protein [Desulfatitalea alkaliphila]
MPDRIAFSEQESAHVGEGHEVSRRFIRNAIEMALSCGDYQKEIDTRCTPANVLGKTIKRVRSLVRFEAAAIYLVDEHTSDLQYVAGWPKHHKAVVADEMEFLIDNGFVAWALRERRGITIYSRDGSRQILLHVLATYNRIRGLLVGIFPVDLRHLPEASLEILSIVLRNAANALESLELYGMLGDEKLRLERMVEEKTATVIGYEKQLMQRQKAEAIAVLAGGIAHQYNNALTGLIGNLDLLEMVGGQVPELMKHIERLRPIAQRMSGLTNQMLAYAQGGMAQPSVVPVRKLIQDVASAIRRILKPTTRLRIELPEDEKLLVRVDVTQMQMVLLAVVGNADEALEGSGEIEVIGWRATSKEKVQRRNTDGCEMVCIQVKDNGVGMDAETLQRVCEPFFSTKAVGRGLGMAAAQGVVKHHGGWMEMDSACGQGTRVCICLPIARGAVSTQIIS